MDNPLALWRDLSIAWLAFWTMVLLAVPGLALFFAQLYLRRFNRWLRVPLLTAHVWVLRIEQGTARVAARIANGTIALSCAGTRFRVTARGVMDFLRGK